MESRDGGLPTHQSHDNDVTTHQSHDNDVTTQQSRDNDVTKKVYNSKDYEEKEDVFAASDEDLKYRMKALALYNGELDDSMDFSTSSRRSKR